MSGPRRQIVVAGSTGSIGTQALEVVRAAPERFEVVALGASSSVAAIAEQAREFRPAVVAMADAGAAKELEALLPPGTEVYAGEGALAALAGMGDVVLNAVVGFAGMGVTVAALEAGSRLALANKESLVAGAPVVQRARLDRRRRAHPCRLGALRHPPVPRGLPRERGRRRRCPAGGHGERWPVPRQAARAARRLSRSPTPSPTPPGGWGRRSPSTRRRS